MSHAKTAEPIEMPFWVDLGGPKEPCIRWVADPQGEEAILGVVRYIEKHWRALQWCTIEMPFGGLTLVCLRKHV